MVHTELKLHAHKEMKKKEKGEKVEGVTLE